MKFDRFAFAAVIAAGLSGCGANGLPAKATVSTIDRTCAIVSTKTTSLEGPDGRKKVISQEKSNRKGDCRSVDEWEDVRTKKKQKVDGTAVVHLDYHAPGDGSYRVGELRFTGLDDEFYDLKAGDEIQIMVAKDDPTRIWKA